uniref:Ribosomal protein L29 n=1 Tax=Cliftonaea pectinata TaxID=2007206 RepID=A0A1Z1MQW1_9FLOR|nr:ribosomal protein L29 [Cliftonaea pectinata]ARW68155.1 ribosomal protein L29 [Cliftonaea pectinata]
MKLNTYRETNDLTLVNIQNEIIKLKKELVILNIKKKTKQQVKPNNIKKTKHFISQMLTLEQIKIKYNQ